MIIHKYIILHHQHQHSLKHRNTHNNNNNNTKRLNRTTTQSSCFFLPCFRPSTHTLPPCQLLRSCLRCLLGFFFFLCLLSVHVLFLFCSILACVVFLFVCVVPFSSFVFSVSQHSHSCFVEFLFCHLYSILLIRFIPLVPSFISLSLSLLISSPSPPP